MKTTAKDYSGQRFGRLIAIERVGTVTHASGKKRAEWLFRCDCGGHKISAIDQRARPQNGCDDCDLDRRRAHGKLAPLPPSNRIDILGQTFGLLTVTRWAGEREWECTCVCGRTVRKRGGDLRADVARGRSPNCGECWKADLIGQKFGMLTVVSLERKTRSGSLWRCRCECGGESIRETGRLKRVKNPGCKQCEPLRRAEIHLTHGGAFMGQRRLYDVWRGMLRRCADQNNIHYGAKGIRVCDEWQDFPMFRHWAHEHGYANGLTIDRMNPNRGYSPSNCEWVTKDENSRRVWRPKYLEMVA